MANDKSFKIKNGLSVGTRYESKAGADGESADGPSDVFNTTLYSGNNGTQTITNNINLSTDGGLVWVKQRTGSSAQHALYDTERGTLKGLASSNNSGSATETSVSSFNSDGFTLGTHNNTSGEDYVSWTFKKATDFFDIVTYTGDSTTSRSISHSLGSVPGCIFIKQTSSTGEDWIVWHRSISNQVSGQILYLNTTDSNSSMNGKFDDTNLPTSTTFTIEQDNSVNASGATYIAYLFAHDTSTDGYIQCGSYTGTGGSGVSVNLGWKPQWVMIKRATGGTANWHLWDNERGIVNSGNDKLLFPDLSTAENTTLNRLDLSSTGFEIPSGNNITVDGSGNTYIYVAIRGIAYNYDMDLSTGTYFSMTPSGDTTFTISNPPASGKAIGFALEVNGDGSALTWPSSVKWHEGTTPTATATKELYTFITTDGGTTYYGKKAGENLA